LPNEFGIPDIPDVLMDDAAPSGEAPEELRDESLQNAEEAEEADPGEEAEQEVPVSVLEEKFGGDIDKLAAAYEEAQKLIGRQGNDLGDARKAAQEAATLREELAELRGLVTGQAAGDEPEGDDAPGSLFAEYEREDILKAFAADPGQFLEATVRAMMKQDLDPRFSTLEEQQASALAKSAEEEQLARAEQMANEWFKSDDSREDLSQGMQKVLDEDRDFWMGYLSSGDQAKVDYALDKMAMLARSQNGNSTASADTAAAKKAIAGKTAPASGYSGSARGRKQDPAKAELDQILAAAKPKSVFG